MTLHLRNTLTRRVEAIEPIDGRTVRMYTCGPTVYRYAHIGNLRTFMLADFIRRALLYHGLAVYQVKNITDVGHMRDEQREAGGDRVLVQAELEGRAPAEIAAHYEAAFRSDEALVNILPAHAFPRASKHVTEMVALAERLEDAGFAYRSPDGTLYYDVARFPGYGQLSGNTLHQLRAGHRGAVAPGKHSDADFALWKLREPGRQALSWQSRWGQGFPGWHLECSAMARRYLGDEFDIHTGGVDNIFPHHEDEIAQTAAITGFPPARTWVHAEHLLAEGRKMAKSAGNFARVTDLAAIGVEPLALRYLALTVRYGHKLHASEESLRGAAAALFGLRARLRALGPPPTEGAWSLPQPWTVAAADTPNGHVDRAHHPAAPLGSAGRTLHAEFVAAIDDDLNLPAALAVVRRVLRAELSADEKRWLALDADLVLGLDLHRAWQAPAPDEVRVEDIARLAGERDAARAAGDYARADSLREELRELGVAVSDPPIASRRGQGS